MTEGSGNDRGGGRSNKREGAGIKKKNIYSNSSRGKFHPNVVVIFILLLFLIVVVGVEKFH